MTWIKELREIAISHETQQATATASAPMTPGGSSTYKPSRRTPQSLLDQLAKCPPPPEIFSVLGIENVDQMILVLRVHHRRRNMALAANSSSGGAANIKKSSLTVRIPTKAELNLVLEEDEQAAEQIRLVYERTDVPESGKIAIIQGIVRASMDGELPSLHEACDELEQLLEIKGDEVMKRLCGMAPKEISSLFGFLNRMIEAIQMTNDERVQTKENYSRTCMLNTEYVGTMDFKLEDGDHYFLWRKGYLTAKAWLDKRADKAKEKEKKKKVGKAIAKELIKLAKEEQGADVVASGEAAGGKAKEGAVAATAATPPPPLPPPALMAAPSLIAADAAGGADDAAPPPADHAINWSELQDSISTHPAEGSGQAVKAAIEKVLSNKALRDDEKLEIISRKLSTM